MPNRPIILTDWQVRAVQEGRLTQIRVPMVPQPADDIQPWVSPNGTKGWASSRRHQYGSQTVHLPPFQPGDILYVREAWKREECTPDCAGREDENECPFNRVGNSCYRYKTQYTNPDVVSNWRSPATMPKEAVRLFLPVGEVRVQRLGDATEEDAIAEGVEFLFSQDECDKTVGLIGTKAQEHGYRNYLWHGNHDVPQKLRKAWAYQYSEYKSARDSLSSLWQLNYARKGYPWAEGLWTFVGTVKAGDKDA